MNKTEKIKLCKEILKSENTTEYYDFLISIFENHSEWIQKKGCGIKNILVKQTKYNNKCFYLERLDGSLTDISYLHSINKNNKLDNIKKACRSAINPIILEFRNKLDYTNLYCEFTKQKLTKENTHIDHYNLTFNELFRHWLKNKNIKQLILNINKTTDNNLDTFFTNQNIINNFIRYHNANTHLRAVSKEANLSLLKKQYD